MAGTGDCSSRITRLALFDRCNTLPSLLTRTWLSPERVFIAIDYLRNSDLTKTCLFDVDDVEVSSIPSNVD